MNSGHSTYRHTAYYLVFLLIVVALAYWPLTFHVLSLKNDALNYFLPVRHMVSESFHQGELPLWTPYLNLGYPLHGDMQSGVWNPFVQFFSLFGSYTLYMLQLETLLYIWLSGAGLFFLLRYFKLHPFANLLGSVAFMLCGFNSDSCQFLNWISGTAILPFVFLFYYRCLHEQSIRFGIFTGVALYFLFTCAYPADFILTAYLLAALLIATLAGRYRKREPVFSRSFFISHLLLVAIFLLLAAPAVLSYMESLPLQLRGKGASYEEVMSNPLHPVFLSSFTTPLPVWKMPVGEITDPLERNSYIGIGAFILAVAAFFIRSEKPIVRFSKWAAVLFLIFSLGEMGGLRILSYYVLPLMNTFRHPANAKMFTLFFLCLLAAFQFNRYLRNEVSTAPLRKAFLLVIILMTGFLIYGCLHPFGLLTAKTLSALFHPANGSSWISHIKTQLEQIRFADIVMINTLIQLLFTGLLYHYWIRKRKIKHGLTVALVNSFVFTLLFLPFTVVKAGSAAATQRLIDAVTVKGYPVPDLTKSIAEYSLDNEIYMAELGCQNLYNKKIGRSDYRISPNNLLSQIEFWENDTSFRRGIMQSPFLYRAEELADPEALVFDTSLYRDYKHINRSAFQTPLKAIHAFGSSEGTEIVITDFKPGLIKGTIRNPSYAVFVLMQNDYPRWTLQVNDHPAEIERTNKTFMGFTLEKGTHRFAFIYSDAGIRPAFLISLATLILVLLYGLFTIFRQPGKKPLPVNREN